MVKPVKLEPNMSDTTKGRTQLADPKLLEVIDKLFEYNIGEYVALPQVSQLYCAGPSLPLTVKSCLLLETSQGKTIESST